MYEENSSSRLNQSTKQDRVKTKIAQIKITQKLIKQLEKLDSEITKLSKQLSLKKQKRTELIEKLDSS